jgi:hypothetical protein
MDIARALGLLFGYVPGYSACTETLFLRGPLILFAHMDAVLCVRPWMLPVHSDPVF